MVPKIITRCLERSRIIPAVLSLVLCLSLTAPASGQPDDAEMERLIDGIEKTYTGRDVAVDFHQASTLKAIDITEEAFGKAWFSYPGKMRWEYLEPETNQIITDGTTVWIYRPLENQVVKGAAQEFFRTGTGGAFLSDISQLRKRYTITLEALESGHGDLLMVPRESGQDIASVRVRIFRDTLDIQKITTVNIYGDTTELVFSNARFGAVDPKRFTFTPPEGVDVLMMNP
jgi:outer membrane lipoprotein carrier protein